MITEDFIKALVKATETDSNGNEVLDADKANQLYLSLENERNQNLYFVQKNLFELNRSVIRLCRAVESLADSRRY